MTLRHNGGDDGDERDRRTVTLYDDEALELMQHWWGGQDDPLYAIYSMGGQHEAWVFEHAIRNLDSDLGRVKKIGRNQYQLGRGTFTKKEIDELHTMRDALQMALDDAGVHEVSEDSLPHNRYYRKPPPPHGAGRHVMDFATLPELVQHEREQNGATHVFVSSTNVYIYYPGQVVGQAWQERGYWHSTAPSARFTGRLRPDAMPIEQFLSDERDGHHKRHPEALDEARGPRFVDVRNTLLEGLRQHGWTVAADLKVPHATSADGTTRLWFKTQAIYVNDLGTDARRFENTHSLSSDMREFRSVDDLLASVERWKQIQSQHTHEDGHTVRDYIAVDHTGRKIAGPFKSYSDAKREADRVRGYVKFAMEEARRTHRRGTIPEGGWSRQNTKISTWFERDRASVVLETLDGRTLVEWWDEDVQEAVEDGFLDPRDWHGSAVEYANSVSATPHLNEASNPPPHMMPPGPNGPRMLPPGPLPPGRRRLRPRRAPFTRRRSGQ